MANNIIIQWKIIILKWKIYFRTAVLKFILYFSIKIILCVINQNCQTIMNFTKTSSTHNLFGSIHVNNNTSSNGYKLYYKTAIYCSSKLVFDKINHLGKGNLSYTFHTNITPNVPYIAEHPELQVYFLFDNF